MFEDYPTFGKWTGGFVLGMGVLFFLGYVALLYSCKKLTQEVEELDQQIKNLENSIR